MNFTIEYIVDGSGVWLNEERSLADCRVKFIEINEELDFTADANDSNPHSSAVIQALLDGDAGAVKTFEQYKAEKVEEMLETKTNLLASLASKHPEKDTSGFTGTTYEELLVEVPTLWGLFD